MAEEGKTVSSGGGKALALAVVALLLGATSLVMAFRPAAPSAPPPPAPTDRVVYMSAVEWKGSTTTDKEPYPGNSSAPAGGGYILRYPDATNTWYSQTYRWEPGVIVVNQGDRVTLKIWGVNGKEHPSTIEGYGNTFTVKRGQLTEVTFTADKAGTFQINCGIHAPSMTAYLLVLPR